jgi:FkbM family methyltransferase
MVSLKNFVVCTIERLRSFCEIKRVSIFDKIALLFLFSIPRTFRNKAKPIDTFIRLIVNRFCYQRTIAIKNLKYRMIDIGSFRQLNPKYEFWIRDYLTLKRGDTFIDVGANIGKHTIRNSRIVGDDGLIAAIEPLPEAYATLKHNVTVNKLKNVLILNNACWNKNTKTKIFRGKNAGHSSLKWNWGLGYHHIEAKTLDTISNDLGLSRIDFIKIDAEGSELKIVEGMNEILKCYSPNIIVEISSDQSKTGIIEIAERWNYKWEVIDETHEYLYLYKIIS